MYAAAAALWFGAPWSCSGRRLIASFNDTEIFLLVFCFVRSFFNIQLSFYICCECECEAIAAFISHVCVCVCATHKVKFSITFFMHFVSNYQCAFM